MIGFLVFLGVCCVGGIVSAAMSDNQPTTTHRAEKCPCTLPGCNGKVKYTYADQQRDFSYMQKNEPWRGPM